MLILVFIKKKENFLILSKVSVVFNVVLVLLIVN